MRSILAPVLGFALAVPAAASVSDFRLPPAATPQPAPDVQGPIAPDVPDSQPTKSSATPRPSPAPSQAPASPPIVVPEQLRPAPTTAPARQAPSPSAAPASERSVSATAPAAQDSGAEPAPTAAPSARPAAAEVEPQRTGGGSPWLWVAFGVALLLAGLALVGWLARRARPQAARPGAVPQVERPNLAPPPPPRPAAPAAASAEPLHVALEPLRLSLTLLNATLAYRLELANQGPAPLTGLTIGADMIAAHASLSREAQLSGPDSGSAAAQPQRIDRLEPGERRVVAGEFRLPFPEIVPIRQGNAALLLPLARVRVEADGLAPLVRTFLVGQPGSGPSDRLQPFRLDQGPRVYPRLAQHAFA